MRRSSTSFPLTLAVGLIGVVTVLAITWPASQRELALDDVKHLRIFPSENADRSLPQLLRLTHWQQIADGATWRPIHKVLWRSLGVGEDGSTRHLWALTALLSGMCAGLLAAALPLGLKRGWLCVFALMPVLNPLSADVILPFVGQADLAAGVGTLGAWVCWRRRGWGWAICGAMAMAFGLLSKESAYPAVIAVPAMLWLTERRHSHRRRSALTALALGLSLLAIRLALQWALFGTMHHAFSAAWQLIDEGERPFGLLETVGRYALAAAVPTLPQTDYSHLRQPGTSAGIFPALGMMALATWGGAMLLLLFPSKATKRTAAALRAKRAAAAGLLWMALMISPYLHLVSLGALWAGRFAFLPLFGVTVLGLAIADLLAGRWRLIPLIWLGGIMVIGVAIIPLRAQDWQSPRALWEAEISRCPDHALAWVNLAAVLQREGNVSDALAAARRATDLRPAYGEAWLARGQIARAAGRETEGHQSLLRAEELLLGHASVQVELAKCEAAAGDFEHARQRMTDLLDREPGNSTARDLLGQIERDLAERGRED